MTRTKVSAEQAALHDQLGVKLFTPPPADFNPLTASDRELLVHGFPNRPDARTEPKLAGPLAEDDVPAVDVRAARVRASPRRNARPAPAGYGG